MESSTRPVSGLAVTTQPVQIIATGDNHDRVMLGCLTSILNGPQFWSTFGSVAETLQGWCSSSYNRNAVGTASEFERGLHNDACTARGEKSLFEDCFPGEIHITAA